jgi:hypothetical protein
VEHYFYQERKKVDFWYLWSISKEVHFQGEKVKWRGKDGSWGVSKEEGQGNPLFLLYSRFCIHLSFNFISANTPNARARVRTATMKHTACPVLYVRIFLDRTYDFIHGLFQVSPNMTALFKVRSYLI